MADRGLGEGSIEVTTILDRIIAKIIQRQGDNLDEAILHGKKGSSFRAAEDSDILTIIYNERRESL